MSWIFFAILAPALFAASSFIDKFLIEKYIKDTLFLTILGGFFSFLFSLIILLARNFPSLDYVNLLIIISSGILFQVALIPYYKAISLEDTSRVVPLFQIVPIFVLLFSFIFLHEIPTKNELLGFFLIVIGGFILSLKELNLKSFKIKKFFWYIVFSCILYAIPSIMFKFVVIRENFWDTLAYEFIGGAIGAMLLFVWWYFSKGEFFREIIGLKKTIFAVILSNEIIYIAARFLIFYAIMMAPVYLVSALSGIGPFFVFIFGLILSIWFPQIIKENIQKSVLIPKIAAIVLIFIGVWFINL